MTKAENLATTLEDYSVGSLMLYRDQAAELLRRQDAVIRQLVGALEASHPRFGIHTVQYQEALKAGKELI